MLFAIIPVAPGTDTLSAAASAAASGDTLQLRAGTYAQNNVVNLPAGVNISGVGPASVISATMADYVIKLVSGSSTNGNQTLEKFKVDGNNDQLDHALLVEKRNNVTLRHVEVVNIEKWGAQFQFDSNKSDTDHYAPSGWLDGIKIYANRFISSANQFENFMSGALQVNHLVNGDIYDNFISGDEGHGIKGVDRGGWFRQTKFRDNTIQSTYANNFGIEIWHTSDETLVYNNTMTEGLSLTYDGQKNTGFSRTVRAYNNRIDMGSDPTLALEVHNNSDVEFRDNYVRNPYGAGAILFNDTGVTIGTQATRNIHIFRNVITADAGLAGAPKGIALWPTLYTADDIYIYNNVFERLESGIHLGADSGGPSSITDVFIKNNVFLNNYQDILFNRGTMNRFEITHNVSQSQGRGGDVYWAGGSATLSNVTQNNNNWGADPGLVKSGAKPFPFYNASSDTSLVVNSGTQTIATGVTASYSGPNPDRGAAERGSTTSNGTFTGTADIGTSGGYAAETNGMYTLGGSGADIWGTSDGFRYQYKTLAGDGQITARIAYQDNTNPYAKAGIMIRSSLDANSANAALLLTPTNGLTFQSRTSAGGTSTGQGGAGGTLTSYWVKLVRIGSQVAAFQSASGGDGTWTRVGTTVTLASGSAYVGLAVTSHDTTKHGIARFTNVTAGGLPGAGTTLLAAQDFEAYNVNAVPAQWTTSGGNWKVDKIGTNSKEWRQSTIGGSGLAYTGEQYWSNYSVESYVAPESDSGSAALLARVQGGNRFYQAELKNNNGTKQLTIYKNDNGAWAQVGSAVNVPWAANNYYLLKFSVNGTSFNAQVTIGSTVYTATGTDANAWYTGAVGTRTDGMSARYDQLKVLSL